MAYKAHDINAVYTYSAPYYADTTKPGEYSYDPLKDVNYQSLAKIYNKKGEQAAQNTLGQIASLNGGYGSSAAVLASQQARNDYNQELASQIPALEQAAYSKYRDKVNDYQWAKEFNQNERNAARQYNQQERWNVNNYKQQERQMQSESYWKNKEFNNNNYWKNKEFNNNNYWNNKDYNLEVRKWKASLGNSSSGSRGKGKSRSSGRSGGNNNSSGYNKSISQSNQPSLRDVFNGAKKAAANKKKGK